LLRSSALHVEDHRGEIEEGSQKTTPAGHPGDDFWLEGEEQKKSSRRHRTPVIAEQQDSQAIGEEAVCKVQDQVGNVKARWLESP